jgi:hypothetical protein
VRRCCAGINSAAIGNAADTTPPAPSPVKNRIMTSCSPVCASGISSVKNVVAITPISTMIFRLKWSDTAEKKKPRIVSVSGGPKISHHISAALRCSGALANTSREPVITRS